MIRFLKKILPYHIRYMLEDFEEYHGYETILDKVISEELSISDNKDYIIWVLNNDSNCKLSENNEKKIISNYIMESLDNNNIDIRFLLLIKDKYSLTLHDFYQETINFILNNRNYKILQNIILFFPELLRLKNHKNQTLFYNTIREDLSCSEDKKNFIKFILKNFYDFIDINAKNNFGQGIFEKFPYQLEEQKQIQDMIVEIVQSKSKEKNIKNLANINKEDVGTDKEKKFVDMVMNNKTYPFKGVA